MNDLEKLEKQVQLKNLEASKLSLLFKIAKMKDEISRIEHNIDLQEKKIEELRKEIE